MEEKFSNKLLVTNIKENKDSQIPKIEVKKIKRKKKKVQTHTHKNYDLLKSYSKPVKRKRVIENKKDEQRRKTENSKRIFEKRLYLSSKNNQSDAYFESSKDKVFKSKEIFEKIKYRNNNLVISKNVENEEKIDYNELSYYEALQRDNRSFLQIFFSVFNLKLEIIQLSFYSKEFSHKSLTLPLYLFNLLLDLTINALLLPVDIPLAISSAIESIVMPLFLISLNMSISVLDIPMTIAGTVCSFSILILSILSFHFIFFTL
jgi:hypothetical protein